MHNLHMCVCMWGGGGGGGDGAGERIEIVSAPWWEQVVSSQLALIVMSVDIWKVLIDQQLELKCTPQEKNIETFSLAERLTGINHSCLVQ